MSLSSISVSVLATAAAVRRNWEKIFQNAHQIVAPAAKNINLFEFGRGRG